ncbi:pyruvate, phosphate dikinase [Reticulibacter mediterranei]|uniref:Pyruvate, phosphate dikinase n=1 Tax=Reticulibacter mediterranei TaxID=2778369 RepID=A0A8J3IVX1_9CHLR|nr:PEP/pyruvate-binding domain-containing protein [Reticulibacter mediterranei]GHO97767.1 pyruvate, phosphate dikinase [Reticulibacter mediterranei]
MSKELDHPLVIALADTSATLEEVGGKGASLARLATAGLPVPAGFHITTDAYRRFVAENGLQERILAAVSTVNADQPAQLEAAAQQIEQLFAQGTMPTEIAGMIRQGYAELGGGDLPVAVRSSATAEDLPEMSFAGQQETYLNMRGEAMVLDAVKRCWASLWTARAIGYRMRHNIAPADVSLAVVVQKLIPADASGILFTANPLNGNQHEVMINAAWGLGEAIVGGQVTPDTLVVEKDSGSIASQEIAEKSVMTVRTPEGTHEEPVPPEKRTQPALTTQQAAELARVGTRIEQLYECPMDIEWAIEDGQIFVVQARPITALPEPTVPAKKELEWKLPQPKGRYMRASVMELLPDPLSPLFATLGLPAWSRITSKVLNDFKVPYIDDPLVIINGYGYYDITYTPALTIKLLLAIPRIFAGELPRLMKSARERWQKEHGTYREIVQRWQAEDLVATSAHDLLVGMREITDEASRYYLTIQSGLLPAAYMSELFFTIAYNKLIKRHDDPSAITFLLGYDSTPIHAEKALYDLAQWVRERPELAAALEKMTGSEFTAAYQKGQVAGVDAETWEQFKERFAAHLAKYGHAIYDLDFAKAVPAEDPGSFLETLKFFLSGQAPNPYTRQQTTAQAREQAVQKILAQVHGVRFSIFRRQLKWAQEMAPLREDGLADVGLGWPILRKMAREIGRRLTEADTIANPDDVFWLTLDELQNATAALDAGEQLEHHQAVVAERHTTWKREHAVTPPVALPPKEGARFLGIDFSGVMPARADQPVGDVIKGTPGSAGRVTGPARVIHGPAEFEQMRQGDILVARITTPAWTPLFALAAGVVTDVGGPLSHSSIVAREYHIPAVLGTGVATERLHNDQRITVDGDAGSVTVL